MFPHFHGLFLVYLDSTALKKAMLIDVYRFH